MPPNPNPEKGTVRSPRHEPFYPAEDRQASEVDSPEANSAGSGNISLDLEKFGGLLSGLREVILSVDEAIRVRDINARIHGNFGREFSGLIEKASKGEISLDEARLEIGLLSGPAAKSVENHLESNYDTRLKALKSVGDGSLIERELVTIAKLSILEGSRFIGEKFLSAFAGVGKRNSSEYKILSTAFSELDKPLLYELFKILPWKNFRDKDKKKLYSTHRLAEEIHDAFPFKTLTNYLFKIEISIYKKLEVTDKTLNKPYASSLRHRLAGVQSCRLALMSGAIERGEKEKISYRSLTNLYYRAADERVWRQSKFVLNAYLDSNVAATYGSLVFESGRSYSKRLRALADCAESVATSDELKKFLESEDGPIVQQACKALCSSVFGGKGIETVVDRAVDGMKAGKPTIFAALLWSASADSHLERALKETLIRIDSETLARNILTLQEGPKTNLYELPNTRKTDRLNYSVQRRSFHELVLALSPLKLIEFHADGGQLAEKAAVILQKTLTGKKGNEARRVLVDSLVFSPHSFDYLKCIVGMNSLGVDIRLEPPSGHLGN